VCLDSANGTVGPLYGSIGKAAGASFWNNGGYFDVPSGSYSIRAVKAGLPCNQAEIAATPGPVTLAADVHITAFLFGNLGFSGGLRGPTIATLRDDVVPDDSTTTTRKVRFVHAAAAFPGPLDLEWRLHGSNNFDVVLAGAPYGGVATSSPLGAVSTDGYVTMVMSTLFGNHFNLRVKGIISSAPPNTMRTQLDRITFPKAKNLTVIVLGDDPLKNEPATTSFLVCPDESAPVGEPIEECAFGIKL
jgi:hypothetical protein